jgi:hypothetical protein
VLVFLRGERVNWIVVRKSCIVLALGDTVYQRKLNDLQRTRLSRRRIIWLLPHPSHREQVVSLFHNLPMCRRSSLLTGEDGGGEKSYEGKKALSSINHSILREVDSSSAEREGVNYCGIER